MRNISAVLLTASLLASTAASAAEGTLAPGKPAGVQKAQLLTTPLIIVGVVAAVAAGVAISQSKSSQAVITQTAGTP
jgi:hypothetical protein